MELQQNQSNGESLEHLFIDFARCIFTSLEAWIASEEVPKITHLQYIFNNSGYLARYETIHRYGELLQRHFTTILKMKEVNDCAQKHWEARILGQPDNIVLSSYAEDYLDVRPKLSAFEQDRYVIIQELLLPILDIAEHDHTFHPTDERLIERYTFFRNLWATRSLRNDMIFPLVNFSSDLQEECELGLEFRLAPFLSEEKSRVWNAATFHGPITPPPMNLDAFTYVQFKLVRSYVRERGKRFKSFHNLGFGGELATILTALRLFKEGYIEAPALFERTLLLSEWQLGSHNITLADSRIRSDLFTSIYGVSETDLPHIKRLINALQTLKTDQNEFKAPYGDLTVALRRFSQAYGRDLIEDHIIDLTIALESSLLAGLRDELNYRLSLRGAALLADAEQRWEPSKSQALLKTMYDVRSGIVHNGQRVGELEKDIRKLQRVGIQHQEFPQQCEQIVRAILREYVLRVFGGQSLKQVNEELDRRIVNGLIPQFNVGE